MRHLMGVTAAAVVAALGANIVGEYELRGAGALVAAALFGIVVAEATAAAGGRDVALRLWPVAGVFAAAGLAWARRIQWEFRTTPVEVLVGIAVGAVVGALWLRTSRGPVRDSPADPPR